MSRPGQLTAGELTTVQGTLQLANRTAQAWLAMKAAAAADGVTLTIAAPGGAYRSHELTLAMRANPKAYNVTPGIMPALNSEHELGICVDVARGLAWVKENGARWGFTFPLTGDPNHARHDGTTAASTPTPITRRNTTMATLYHKQDSKPTLYALAGDSPGTPANWLETTAQSLANAWSAQIGGPSAAINQATWDAYKADYRAPLAIAGTIPATTSATVYNITGQATPASGA